MISGALSVGAGGSNAKHGVGPAGSIAAELTPHLLGKCFDPFDLPQEVSAHNYARSESP